MTGLEKILKAIEEEAMANADTVISKANQEAEEIIAAATSEAQKKCAEIATKSEADVNAANARAQSAATLQERKLMLEAKQQVISNVILNAKNTLLQLPVSEYFDVILRMVLKYAVGQSGSIIFSETDKKRLPQDFQAKIQTTLANIPGASLIISDRTASIDGGFILIYGEVEENCSFDAIFSASKDMLQDKVSGILFE